MVIKNWYTIGPREYDIGITPDQYVALRFLLQNDEIGLAQGWGLAIRIKPAEAREIAQTLIRAAQQAETHPIQR